MANVSPQMIATYSAQQWEVFNAFNDASYVRDQMDIQQTPLYDEFTIAAGSALNNNTSALFTQVGGTTNKTINQTNLTVSGQLASPEAFSIKQFRLRWSEDILRLDLTNLLNGFVFDFFIGKKVYMQLPIWMCPAGGGITGFSDISSESAYTNGLPGANAVRSIALPLVISSKANFNSYLDGPSYTTATSGNKGTGILFYCVLEGFYARGVQ